MNHIDGTFQIAVLASLACVGALIVFIRGRVLRGRLARLHPGLPGSLNASFLSPKFTGVREGLPFVIRLSTGSKHTPRKLHVELPTPLAFKLTVLKENLLTGFTKQLRLTREIESGNALFDAEFLLLAEDAPAVQAFVSDPQVQETIRAVLAMNYTITFNNIGIIASKSYYDQNQDLDPLAVGQILHYLLALHLTSSAFGMNAGFGV